MAHDSLVSYYSDNLNTVFYDKDLGFNNNFTVSELDSLLPWERDIYMLMMRDKVEEFKKLRQSK